MKTFFHMLATLVLVGCFSGAALSLVGEWASPLIAAHEYRAKMEAVKTVVPGGAAPQSLSEWIRSAEMDSAAVQTLLWPEAYLLHDSTGQDLGWALKAVGTGFQDKIHLMVGLSLNLQSTCGIKILKDTETPGLGTWIREGDFPDQFFVHAAHVLSLEKPLELVKVEATQSHEVQAITGATISSRAVMDIVNQGVKDFRLILSQLHSQGANQ
jgi:Na+-translocating ferredoxin:NAD+ oxidoreductase subunit G